jgi:hypothetical protein
MDMSCRSEEGESGRGKKKEGIHPINPADDFG